MSHRERTIFLKSMSILRYDGEKMTKRKVHSLYGKSVARD